MHIIHINIGSNQGDRKAIIGRAVALIADAFAPARIRLSDYIESAPWGYSSSNMFYNRGILVETECDIAPLDTLARTKAIENIIGCGASHRNPDGTYCDRAIDIDIIDFDGVVYESDELTLPHPRADKREFVLSPLSSLDPEWRHPISRLTAAELLKNLGDDR